MGPCWFATCATPGRGRPSTRGWLSFTRGLLSFIWTVREKRYLTSGEPLRLARASRDQHGSEGARSPGQDHLVGEALIRAQRSFGCEEIRRDVGVPVRGAGCILRVGLIEYAHREQPQHGSGQGYDDAITSSFGGAPSQGLKNTNGAEPAHHVVA